MTAAVEIIDVGMRFGEIVALDHVDLVVHEHEFVSLLGASGCGKTTLLRIVAGFEVPTSGRVKIRGEDVTAMPPHRRPTNIVFQRGALFPHMNVFDNIAYSLKLRRWPKARIAAKVEEMLALVRLDGLGHRGASELSGWQVQRPKPVRSGLSPCPAPQPLVGMRVALLGGALPPPWSINALSFVSVSRRSLSSLRSSSALMLLVSLGSLWHL